MRVLLDTSILISNLYSPNPTTSATGEVLRVAFNSGFTLLFVEGVAEELYRKLRERPDLAARIPLSDAEQLIADMRAIAEIVPRLPEPHPPVGRDRNDDFLFAHGILAGADYLISWDKPLLDLKQIGGMRIVSPPKLLHLLRAAGHL
jgi:putative PIN family toxin of toxin-antitoxin system